MVEGYGDMVIRTLVEADIKSVAQLEAEVYPRWMQMGYLGYLHHFKLQIPSVSVGVFNGEKLAGYALGFRGRTSDSLYVADLVSQNPKTLLPMLRLFFQNCEGKTLTAECRESSHTLLRRLNERFAGLMTIREDKLAPRYFGGEDGYFVTFQIHEAAKLAA